MDEQTIDTKAQDGTKITVVGAGSWGTALANVFADAGAVVTVWAKEPGVVQGIQSQRENPVYLKGIPLSERISATSDLAAAVGSAEVVVCAIPTQFIRGVFSPVGALLGGKVVVNASKGIEMGTFARVSEIFHSFAPGARYVVLSGPSFAHEVAKRLPTAVTVASLDRSSAARVQGLVATPYFRAYRSSDVLGVELAGALKNVIAIASGIVAGLDLGYNAQAAIVNRGVAEIVRVGTRLGAQSLTFMGLSGMGDLILTCTGPLSRNRRLGVGLAQGKSLAAIQGELGGVAEGVTTTQAAYELATKFGIEMPITEQVHRILYEGSTPQKALGELMSRDLKPE